MSNLVNEVKLITQRVERGSVNDDCLYNILMTDNDFGENEDYFREDTYKLGFVNEADRVSKEIFEKYQYIEDEAERLKEMIKELFTIDNFIADEHTGNYGHYEFKIIESDFEFIVIIAVII